jgi:NAD(P)-dependent dehydrogenase (short-subunit alcohol dehydrogenase family)
VSSGQEVACPGQRFGTASTKQTEQDRFGRVRRLLSVEYVPHGLGVGPVAFDLDEIEWMAAHGEFPECIPDIGLHRQLDPRATLFHALLPGPFVLQVHRDALCTLAGAPDPLAGVESAFGGRVRWSACPPTPASIAALAGAEDGPLLIPGLGLFLSGGLQADVAAKADCLDDQATAFLTGPGRHRAPLLVPKSTAGGPTKPAEAPISAPNGVGTENLVASVRGLLSDPDRVLLALSEDERAYAARPDLERLLATAGALEPGIAVGGIRMVCDLQTARTALARPQEAETSTAGGAGDERHARLPARVTAVFIPVVGLLGVGRDEVEAGYRLRAAAHGLAVAAVLLDDEPPAKTGLSGGAPPKGLPTLDHGVPVEALEVGRGNGLGSFVGRAFIVTGAASGIGRDIARHLASKGARLGLGDINEPALNQIADELEAVTGRPVTVAGDLADEVVVDQLVTATARRFGGIDGAVFNAGVAIPGAIKNLSAADWHRSFEVNATAHFLLAKRLLPLLETQGIGGSVVFIGSKNMFSPGAGFGAYSASKGALAQLARVVAIEGGPFGIRSNIVNPDNVFEGSHLWSPELRAQRAAVYGIRPEDLENYYTQRNLLKVPITGMDVAKAVAFLLSDDALRTTACVLTVDGGVPGVFPR